MRPTFSNQSKGKASETISHSAESITYFQNDFQSLLRKDLYNATMLSHTI